MALKAVRKEKSLSSVRGDCQFGTFRGDKGALETPIAKSLAGRSVHTVVSFSKLMSTICEPLVCGFSKRNGSSFSLSGSAEPAIQMLLP